MGGVVYLCDVQEVLIPIIRSHVGNVIEVRGGGNLGLVDPCPPS